MASDTLPSPCAAPAAAQSPPKVRFAASPSSKPDDTASRWGWKPELAFGLGLTASWAAIAVLWSITPLCYLYVIWTLVTLAPSLEAARPARSGALQVMHYVALAYCALEIPFSIYYKILAVRAQKLLPTQQYTRKYLREVFQHSLENGLHDEDDDLLDAWRMAEAPARDTRGVMSDAMDRFGSLQEKMHLPESFQERLHLPQLPELRIPESIQAFRQRRATTPGTPDIALRELPTLPMAPMQGSSEMQQSPSMDTLASSSRSKSARPTTPSFMLHPLAVDDPRAKDFREYLRVWFSNAPYEEIGRLDVASWLAWSLYGQPYEELVREREEWDKAGRPTPHVDGKPDVDEEGLEIEGSKVGLVEHCIELVEARAARPFKPGRNPAVKPIRLTLDPVRVVSRPLILYVFVWALQNIVIGNAMRHGFRWAHDEIGEISYLVRIPEGWKPAQVCPESQRPLIFIHGLGMGMAQYATLLNHFATSKLLADRPILIIIQPHISMSFFSKNYLKPPKQDDCTASIKRITEKFGFDKPKLTVLSHSNGTIVHGWLAKKYPDLVARSCFVDPVCFCLWEPWVCYNFLYSNARTPIEYLMRFFRELGVALMLSRSFDWSANLLMPYQLANLLSPHQTAFFLAERDSILNAERMRQYLVRAGVREVARGQNVGAGRGGLKVHYGKKHGESMIGSGRAFNQIMSWVRCEEGQLPGLSDDGGESD